MSFPINYMTLCCLDVLKDVASRFVAVAISVIRPVSHIPSNAFFLAYETHPSRPPPGWSVIER